MAVWGRARYLSVTEALHNIESLRVSREETFFFFFKLEGHSGAQTRNLQLSNQAALTTAPGPPLVSEWILFYVAFCKIMEISWRKDALSLGYAILLSNDIKSSLFCTVS